MSFKFAWASLNDDECFMAGICEKMQRSLNEGATLPPNIVSPLLVKDLYLGSEAPRLELLQLVDLKTTRLEGVFQLKYSSNGYLVLTTKVQVNPMSSNSGTSAPSLGIPSKDVAPGMDANGTAVPGVSSKNGAAMMLTSVSRPTSPLLSMASPTGTPLTNTILAANRPLIVPMSITITDLVINGIFKLATCRPKTGGPEPSASFHRRKTVASSSPSPSPLSSNLAPNSTTTAQTSTTLHWINDPLAAVVISSSFDSIPKLRENLQSQIEQKIRNYLLHELPSYIYNTL